MKITVIMGTKVKQTFNIGISDNSQFWNTVDWKALLIGKLIVLLTSACQPPSKIRPVTIELAINLLIQLCVQSQAERNSLDDKDFALLEQAKEESIMVARSFYKVMF